MEGDYSRDINIRRGVRQGCVLSHTPFNMNSKHIFNKALGNTDSGVIISGERLHNTRYADDTVVFIDSLKGLHELMDRVVDPSSKYRLPFCIRKTTCLVISKHNNKFKE